MKIIVTGSSGWLGTEVCRQLQEVGHIITEYDKRSGQDILNEKQLQAAMVGQDVVIHLAAIPHPDKSKLFEDYFIVNVNGTNAVASAAAQAGVKRMIYSSSTAYYGAQRGLPFHPVRGMVETSKNAVQSYYDKKMPELTDYLRASLSYACSKVAAETVLAAYGMGRRLEVIILRVAPVIKTREPYEWGLLAYVEVAGAAFVQAVELPGQRWYEAYNIQNEDAKTMKITRWLAALKE